MQVQSQVSRCVVPELVTFDSGWTVNSEDPMSIGCGEFIEIRRTYYRELAIHISSGKGDYNLYITMTGLGWIKRNATIEYWYQTS